MSGYIEAGYIVVLIVLAAYAASLLSRERRARRRLGREPVTSPDPGMPKSGQAHPPEQADTPAGEP